MSTRIHALRLTPYRLPLAREWVSAAGGFAERRGWLLRLEDRGGRVGWGECAPLPKAGTEQVRDAARWLKAWLPECLKQSPRALLRRLDESAAPPAARCSVESALLDLEAQAAGLPLARHLHPEAATRVRSNAFLGPLGQHTLERAREAWERGYRVMKIKVGVSPLEQELNALSVLAAGMPGGLLRLDANRAWDQREAESAARWLHNLPVESLEEPLRHPEPRSLERIQHLAPCPVALDESLAVFDHDALLAAPPVRRLVLKPMARGGVGRALALGRRARQAGMECVVTTTVDAAPATALALHLAATLDDGLLAHGLATGGWLADDLGRAIEAQPRIPLPARAGLGFTPKE